MPRPKTKDELLNLSQANFKKLIDYIEGLPEDMQTKEFPKGTLNRNIDDVLAHLHHWHRLFMHWYKEGMDGKKPEMPASGYTWKTLPELNRTIWQKYKQMELPKAKSLFASSHKEMLKLIEAHSNEELFEKKRYNWTGSTSLGAYIISATSSHYDWALKLIKKATK